MFDRSNIIKKYEQNILQISVLLLLLLLFRNYNNYESIIHYIIMLSIFSELAVIEQIFSRLNVPTQTFNISFYLSVVTKYF